VFNVDNFVQAIRAESAFEQVQRIKRKLPIYQGYERINKLLHLAVNCEVCDVLVSRFWVRQMHGSRDASDFQLPRGSWHLDC
jgi:hypothetical protein